MIRVSNLVKSYGELKVLDGVSFDIEQGEFIVIFGSSGAGKTTLLNILATYDKPDEGEVIFDRINIINTSENSLERFRIEKIGFAHQSSYMIECLPLYENVALPLILAGFSKQEKEKVVAKLLKEVGLEDKAKNRPSQLSLGQKKRACIARALVTDPRFILIDEPTANLDVANKERILALLSQKQKGGATIIVATHDQIVTKHAKVLELTNGKLVPLETEGGV
jgi:ABC-type lipoprotein export system ATPase subunit